MLAKKVTTGTTTVCKPSNAIGGVSFSIEMLEHNCLLHVFGGLL